MKTLFRLHVALAVLALAASSGCSKKEDPTKGPNARPRFAPAVENSDAPPLGDLGDEGSDLLVYDESLGEPLPPLGDETAMGGDNPFGMTDPALGAEGGIPLAESFREEPMGMIAELQTVYFPLNSFELSPDTQAALDANAQWMQSNPAFHIQIEGHCDERGTLEYNLNLGQNRADMVREYLTTVWQIDPARLHSISYGEERPIGADHNLNRRAQFLVYDPNA